MNWRKLLFIFWPPALLMFIHGIISIFGWHQDYHYISVTEHFVGGMAIALSIFNALTFRKYPKEIHFSLPFLITALATIIWEFYEFLSDKFLHTTLQQSIANTMEDMLLGILGGLLVTFFFLFQE